MTKQDDGDMPDVKISREIGDGIKRRFARFSHETSCHGFLQLYNAKSRLSTFLWFTLISGSFTITGYLVYLSVWQFINQPTSTVLSPAKEDQILYPPLRLCYENWMFWVDAEKIRNFNISKEALLFALNFFETIFTENDKFNITRAEMEFRKIMRRHNMTLLSQFYRKIHRDVPLETDKNNLTEYFDKVDIIYNDPKSYLFCYGISEVEFSKYFQKNVEDLQYKQSGKTVKFSVADKTYDQVRDFVTANEYGHYMRQWVREKSAYKVSDATTTTDFSKFAPPIMLYPNAFETKGTEIFLENDAYFFDVWASCYNLKSNRYNRCKPEYRSVASNDSCKNVCKARRWKVICTCMSLDLAIVINDDKLERLCQKGIKYISPNEEGGQVQRRASICPTLTTTVATYANQKCSDSVDTTQVYQKCKSDCAIPCDKWTYGHGVTVQTTANFIRNIGVKNATNIVVQYPYANNIIVMTEINSQSWENFVGSVGGLLGIFTGASILSFFQLFYLCFFSGVTCNRLFKKCRLKKDKEPQQIPTDVNCNP